MIQRIQSVFLFLVGSSLVLSLFFPFWYKSNPQTEEWASLTAWQLEYLKQTQSVSNSTTVYLGILAIVCSLVAFTSLFSYRNRFRQMQLNFLNTLLMVVLLGLSTYQIIGVAETFFSTPPQGNFGVGFYALISAMLFNSLANRFIRKDDNLVKSADRLR